MPRPLTCNLRFPGQYYQAETGLNQNIQRDYDPLTGRYAESDPLGLRAGLNTYSYVSGNPVSNVGNNQHQSPGNLATGNSVYGTFDATSTITPLLPVQGLTVENMRAGDCACKAPIPAGKYGAFVRRDHSPNRVELLGVTGYKNIQIHNDSYPRDFEGCIGVWNTSALDFLGGSRRTLEALLALIRADGSGRITVNVNSVPFGPTLPSTLNFDSLSAMIRLYRSLLITLGLALLGNGVPTAGICGPPEPGDRQQPSCQAAIARFLQAPTSVNLAQLRHSGADMCRSGLKIEQLQALDKLVARGSKLAATLLAPHVRRLDGGELEDSLRSFGQFATHRMHDFMILAASGALTDRESTAALTMLPPDLEDNFGAQIAELKARRTALEGLPDPQLQDRRTGAITAIDAFIADIDRARSSYESQKHRNP